jgi:lysine 6-dehydrogenase
MLSSRVHLLLHTLTDVVWQQRACDEEATRAGVSVVPDCGMGPGLNVSLATYVMSRVERPRDVLIWDGGLPQDPEPPWNYVSTFAIAGLTNEYGGHATFLRDGRITPVPCFADLEHLDFPRPVGRLEAFVTSGGLSTAPWTLQGRLQRLENKTLRYPGHCAQFKAFSDVGLMGLEPIEVNTGPTPSRGDQGSGIRGSAPRTTSAEQTTRNQGPGTKHQGPSLSRPATSFTRCWRPGSRATRFATSA